MCDISAQFSNFVFIAVEEHVLPSHFKKALVHNKACRTAKMTKTLERFFYQEVMFSI